MIFPAVALSLLLSKQLLTQPKIFLPNPFGGPSVTEVVYDSDNRMERPKLSPKTFGESKQPFEFDFLTCGYANPIPQTQSSLQLRFRVYSQERKRKDDVGLAVTQMLLRLWQFDYNVLGFDHKREYHNQLVDVYLCWGGAPGGEQLFDVDNQDQQYTKVNSIYIYDLPSFKGAVEMAREVAHEYGHAALPAVGGFKTPEDWGNGYLGEKLFLVFLRDQISAGKLGPEDAMGATAADLTKWIDQNVDPLIASAAKSLPNTTLLSQEGKSAMDAYMGLNLYASALLPESVFARSLVLIGDTKASAIPDAILSAVDEPDLFAMTVPKKLVGKPIWVPISNGHLLGVKPVRIKNGWALIDNAPAVLKLKNR